MSYKKWTDLISVTMKKAAHYADNLPDGPVRQGRSPGEYPVNRSFPGKLAFNSPCIFHTSTGLCLFHISGYTEIPRPE